MRSIIEAGQFARPENGTRLCVPLAVPSTLEGIRDLPLTKEPAWQSNGGLHNHPLRSLPFVLDVPVPKVSGRLIRIHLVGIFAHIPEDSVENPGSVGAQVQLIKDDRAVFRHDLVRSRHYCEASDLEPRYRLNGDGTSVETLGSVATVHGPRRVDLLTLDVEPTDADAFRFRDTGSAASFLIFDVFFEFEAVPVCPFKGSSGGVPLAEVGAVVRIADRVKFNRAIRQLEDGIIATTDLDEARSMALTFMAVVSAALLEMGAPREMHHFQLRAARTLDRLESTTSIAETTRHLLEEIVAPVLAKPSATGDALIDRALLWVDRHFGKDIQDVTIADQLGLSTSHFRFLFKQATGQPFHKYLVSLRLEKARQMLLGQDLPVSEIARSVGFASAAHFSRAFQKRFSVSPSAIRQARR